MKIKSFILLIAFVLCGCASYQKRYSYNDGKDYISCRQIALQEVQMTGLGQNMFNEFAIDRRINECMSGLGH